MRRISANQLTHFTLIGILLLALALRLWRSDAFGIGAPYNAAGSANMLQSPYHFFFNVADSGGVTIDKTPIALWLQALGIAFFGKNGFALAIVSIFASSLSIAILYRLVAQDFGRYAGLLATFTFAINPISIAVNRSNVPDSILVLAMLLATWGFFRAFRQSTLASVCIAALLLAVAFNVKMLQGLIHAPALYAAYFFGARGLLWQKFRQLLIATVIFVIAASSWLLIVQLVPAESRPYIGGTRNNSAIELVFGYSALLRILGGSQYAALSGDAVVNTSLAAPSPEIGVPGVLRFFQYELGNETSWLLVLALWGGLLTFSRTKIHLPLDQKQRAGLLWGGWLLTGIIVFSSVNLLHAFYLSILAPPISALVAIAAHQLWEMLPFSTRKTHALLLAIIVSTLGAQFLLLSYYVTSFSTATASCALILFLIAQVLKTPQKKLLTTLAAILVIPLAWGIATAGERTDIIVPVAYHAREYDLTLADLSINLVSGEFSIMDLVQRDERVRYDLLVSNQSFGAHITMQTDLRILYLGGFSGNDPIYRPEDIRALLEAGQIGYVLRSEQHPDIMEQVAQSCSPIRTLIEPIRDPQTNLSQGGIILYACI